jgi:aryl-alcohol dehydrogenase-like predicted oxidoreductase
VSVQKVEEGLKALEYPRVATIQIIFNIFRQRPAGLLFEQARRHGVGLIIRVPLASGVLTGKFSSETRFADDDHRSFNRHGEQFDVGETFAGVDYETGVAAADELKALVPPGATLTQFALRWILDHESVSTVIAGAKTSEQARDNAAASDLQPLPEATREAVAQLYRDRIAPQVHQRW